MGLLGATAEWVFAFPERISVTVSGADSIVDRDREDLARTLWRDVAAAHRLAPELPPWQIVKEKRATFRATPEQAARRAGTRTPLRNVFLAGDWTATGLPATIEGAVRSGQGRQSLRCPRREDPDLAGATPPPICRASARRIIRRRCERAKICYWLADARLPGDPLGKTRLPLTPMRSRKAVTDLLSFESSVSQ